MATVQGKIISRNPADYTTLLVMIYDRDLRSEEQLATAVPDAKGNYTATYSLKSAANAEAGTADLLVKVMDRKQRIVGQSSVLFNASENETIDVTLDAELYKGLSELDMVTRKVTPLLDKLKPAALTEDEAHKDISFLSGELELKEDVLECFAAAHKLNEKAPVDVAFYYAVLRQNLPARALLLGTLNFKKPVLASAYIYLQPDKVLKALRNNNIDEIKTAVENSYQQNIISGLSKDVIERWMEQWRKIQGGEADAPIQPVLLENILAVSGLAEDKKKVFLDSYFKAETVGLDFWKKIKADKKMTASEAEKIKAVYDLSSIVNHDTHVITHVTKKFNVKDSSSLRNLSALGAKDWTSLLKDAAKDASINGDKAAIEEEGKRLAERFEKEFPTAAFTAKLQKEKNKMAGASALQDFHTAFPDVELHKINIPQFIEKNRKNFKFKEKETTDFTNDLLKIQRVFKIAPTYEATKVLLDNDVHSAAGIYRMGEDNFVNLVTKDAAVTTTAAKSMFQKAETTYALSLAIAGDFHSITSGGALNALPKMEIQSLENSLLKEFPDMQALFGSADMCECEHCRSVYSPAAYLVDLLEYIDKKGSTTSGQTVKDVLFKRRPDIGQILLNCANSNTAMPFIDLVCEILENVVKPDGIAKQTTLTAPELKARPQYINYPAYDDLKAKKFPFVLPFDLAWHTTTGYLSIPGINRYDLMNAFRITGSATDLEMAFEYLGIPKALGNVIITTDAANPTTYWGNTATITEVNTFLTKTSLEYKQMLQLFDCSFINPSGNIKITVPDGASMCDSSIQTISGLDNAALDRIHRFLRLNKQLGWSMQELNNVVMSTTLGGQSINDTLLIKLQQFVWLQKKLVLTVPQLLAMLEGPDTLPLATSDRYKKLARSLNISVTDLLLYIELQDDTTPIDVANANNPFTNINKLYEFCQLIPVLQSLSLKPNQYNYIFTNRVTPEEAAKITTGITTYLETVRKAFKAIDIDLAIDAAGTNDPTAIAALTKQQRREQMVILTAKQFAITERMAASLLDTLELTAGNSFTKLFIEDANIAGSNTIDETNFADLYKASRLLRKIAVFVNGTGLSQEQVDFLLQHHATAGLLSFNQLPLTETAARPFMDKMKSMERFISFHKKYSGDEEVNIIACLKEAIVPGGTQVKLNSLLTSLTQWDSAQWQVIAGYFSYSFPASYQSINTYYQLDLCVELANALKAGINDIKKIIQPELTKVEAQLTEDLVKAPLETDAWLARSGEVQDPIRELKRNALTQYLINNPVAGEQWNNSNDLYSYYLIDVEMGSCEVTTRVLQAGLSIQLFVQRCLMQLEKEVLADAEKDRSWLQWKWMKNYRVWEANRKVFLYPENYLEPELRPDKSSFFKDLENDLMQNEINAENVETGYLNYLEKLDNVARLNVCGTYYDENTLIFHVFAHTYDEPRIYYYRKWVKDRYWTPWEKVTADIQSDQLIPVVRNSRLYIYWPEFNEVNEEPSDSELSAPKPDNNGNYPSASKAKKYSEIRLAVSEFKNKKWSPKKLSKTKIDTRGLSGGSSSYSRENFVFVPIIDSLRSVLDYLYMFMGSDPTVTDAFEDFLEQYDIRNRNVIVCLYEREDVGYYDDEPQLKHIKTFDLASCHGSPEIADSFTAYTSSSPLIPYFDRSGYYDGEDIEVYSGTPDALTFHQWGAVPFVKHAALLNKTPGKFRTQFSLQLSLIDKFFYTISVFIQKFYSYGKDRGLPYSTSSFLPFFYEDKSRTFMVQPEMLIEYEDADTKEIKADEFFYSDVLQFIREFAATRKLPLELKKYTEEGIKYNVKPSIRFRNFYHPLACFFMKQVYVGGLDGLLNRDVQLVGDMSITDTVLKDKIRNKFKDVKLFDFKKVYDPTAIVNAYYYPEEEVDFSPEGSYSQYNWELFFHGPLYVAAQLSSNQRFDEAMQWYHYIFNPTDASAYDSPQKYWITKPFFLRSSTAPNNEYLKQRIDQLLGMIHNNDTELLKRIGDWKDNPFQPHLIAQFRTVAYQKSVVMKYIDNLVAWGDQLFRLDTRENLNQAAQLYILAAEILGPKPKVIPNKNGQLPKSYNELKPGLDKFSNAVIQLENIIPAVPDSAEGSSSPAAPLPAIETFYFCLPINEKLLTYWDTISDRLFKLRNCMTIDGETRSSALFDPPIDPAMLVRAVAAGVNLQDALSDMNAPLPYYRFNMVLQKAKEFNNEVKALGSAILTAMEKKDVEAMSLLRSTCEMKVLQASKAIKEYSIQEAKETLAGLKHNKRNTETKIQYYGGRQYMNPLETASFGLSTASTVIHTIGSVADVLAGALALIPQFNGGASGFGGSPHVTVSYGSEQISKAAELGAKVMYQTSAIMDKVSGLVSTQAGYVRRKEEWDFQKTLAQKELLQIERQIAGAEIKIAMAEKELRNHELQIENADKTDEFMRTKFSNIDLYSWMVTQLSGVYFQSYKLALDMAKKAERCYRFELGVETTSFIQPNYWDSLYKGLQSADKLAFDLNRMDGSYLDQNKREHEMNKTVSLSLLDAAALIQLKETGSCEIMIPEALFDLDCPGHYMRRIKSVNVSIPCITGPYSSVNCKLTLLSSMVRKKATTSGTYFRDTAVEDARFIYNYGVIQSIITSSAQNDNGMFESNLRDERYLPFEGQGAISRWKIELSQLENSGNHIRNFDFNTISDVMVQMRYTARYGGDAFRTTVNDAITGSLNTIIEYASAAKNKFYRALPLKHELATEWHRFLHPATPNGDQELLISLTKEHFPFFLKDKNLQVTDAVLYVKYKKGVNVAPFQFSFEEVSVANPPSLGAATDEYGVKKYSRSALNNAVPANNALEYKLTGWKQQGGNRIRFTGDEVEDVTVVLHYEVL